MYTKINYIIKFGKILKLLFLGHQPHTDVCNQHRTVRERNMQEKKKILNRVLAY